MTPAMAGTLVSAIPDPKAAALILQSMPPAKRAAMIIKMKPQPAADAANEVELENMVAIMTTLYDTNDAATMAIACDIIEKMDSFKGGSIVARLQDAQVILMQRHPSQPGLHALHWPQWLLRRFVVPRIDTTCRHPSR